MEGKALGFINTPGRCSIMEAQPWSTLNLRSVLGGRKQGAGDLKLSIDQGGGIPDVTREASRRLALP